MPIDKDYPAVATMQSSPLNIPSEVTAAIQRGNKLEAIKLLRNATGLGLKEAKDIVDRIGDKEPFFLAPKASQPEDTARITSALEHGDKLEAIRLYREQNGVGLNEAKDAIDALVNGRRTESSPLAPGEVKRSGGAAWIVIALFACAIAAYLLSKFG